MATSTIMLPVTLMCIAGSMFASGLKPINPNELPKGVCIIRIVNISSSDELISFDGSPGNDFVRKEKS